jgi:hypothetical protein
MASAVPKIVSTMASIIIASRLDALPGHVPAGTHARYDSTAFAGRR